VHARENAEAKALCGKRPDDGRWSRRQADLTCMACIDEVLRRRTALVHFARPRELTLCGRGVNRSSMWPAVTCPKCLRLRETAWIPPSRH
jgi:hypothetical protein